MQGQICVLQQLFAVGCAGGKQDDAHTRGDIDQLPLHQVRTAEQIDQLARKGSRRLRLRSTGLDDAELVASQPGNAVAMSERGTDPVCDEDQKPITNVAPERFIDGLEAAEINHQNGAFLGRTARILQQPREVFVEHQTIAEFGQGVGARLGRSFGHVVSTDQPAAIHRYCLDPERAAIRKGDLAIVLAIVGTGFAVDTIENFVIAEQFFENKIWLKHFSVRPDNRDGPVHTHECLERQLRHANGSTTRFVAAPRLRKLGGIDWGDGRTNGHSISGHLLRCE